MILIGLIFSVLVIFLKYWAVGNNLVNIAYLLLVGLSFQKMSYYSIVPPIFYILILLNKIFKFTFKKKFQKGKFSIKTLIQIHLSWRINWKEVEKEKGEKESTIKFKRERRRKRATTAAMGTLDR